MGGGSAGERDGSAPRVVRRIDVVDLPRTHAGDLDHGALISVGEVLGLGGMTVSETGPEEVRKR